MNGASHDVAALRVLAEADWVHRIARALLRDPDLAADAAQEALVAALEAPPDAALSPDVGRLRAWLSGVTRNRAARQFRSRMPMTGVEIDPSDAAPSGADAAARLELHRRITRSVESLSEPYRSTIVAHYFDGLSAVEIARRDGVQHATVRQRLSRGVKQLRGALDGEYGDRRAWHTALIGVLVPRSGSAVGGNPDKLPSATTPTLQAVASLIALGTVAVTAWWWFGSADHNGSASPAIVPEVARHAGVSKPEAEPVSVETVRTETNSIVGQPVAATTRFACVVTMPDGRPASNAALFRWSDVTTQVDEATTDADGIGWFAATPHAAGVVAVVTGYPPALASIDSDDADALQIVIEPGARLAGTITVGGLTPPWPLTITRSVAPDSSLMVLPERLADRLKHRNLITPEQAVTDHNGRFEFDGLQSTWAGRIGWSLGVPLVRFDDALETDFINSLFVKSVTADAPVTSGVLAEVVLGAPATTLTIDLERRPGIRGRLLWSDDRTPVHWAMVDVAGIDSGGEGIMGGGARSHTNGRFDVKLEPGTLLRRATLSIVPAGMMEGQIVELDAHRLQPDRDVGDILVTRPPTYHLLFVDAAANPIEGARTAGWGSVPSDVEGRTTAQLMNRGYTLAAAPGYRVGRVTLDREPGTKDHPIRIQLLPGNRLTVRALDTSGAPLQDARLEVVAPDGPWFGGSSRKRPTNLHEALSGLDFPRHRRGRNLLVSSPIDAPMPGIFRFESLVPGVKMTFRLLSVDGEVHDTKTVTAPEFGDLSDVVELRESTSTTTKQLQVRFSVVHADTGAPIAGAMVLVATSAHAASRSSGSGRRAITNTLGRATLTVADSEIGFLRITRSGYVSHLESFSTEEMNSKNLHTIAMQEARSTRFELVDSSGAPERVTRLGATVAGTDVELPTTFRGDGAFLVHDIPRRDVELAVRTGWGDDAILVRVPADRDVVRVVVE